MLVVDASCLYSMFVDSHNAEGMRLRLNADPNLAAPHIIDVEVLGVIRRDYLRGDLDRTAAFQAVGQLRDWPGARYGHQLLLDRAWELRANVRGWDATYVALAELLGATLITTDARLARAVGPRCRIEVLAE
jgi:predicted nucleic acid-binding protein